MKKSQSGFTLIELVVVIVLLGILGVTALGKFENLSADAADAAENGIAGELSSASAINYAANLVNDGGATIATADCATGASGAPGDALNSLMASGAAPTNANLSYAFSSGNFASAVVPAEDAVCASGDTFSCTITDKRGSNGDTVAIATDGVATVICTG